MGRTLNSPALAKYPTRPASTRRRMASDGKTGISGKIPTWRVLCAHGGSGEGSVEAGPVGWFKAARDRFYKGDIAREMAKFPKKTGAFPLYDFASYSAKIEEPVSTNYRAMWFTKTPRPARVRRSCSR